MTKLVPFADDAASVSIAELTIENGTERIALYGSLDITRDKVGLARAKALMALLTEAVQHLEREKDLPDAVPAPRPAKSVSNPFAFG